MADEILNNVPEEDMEPDLVELEDDQGNTITMEVVDYFFYQGQEYVILSDYSEEETEDEESVDCYVMKVVVSTEDGEEFETFEPIEDEKLEARLIEVANTRLNEDAEADEEV